MADDRILDDEPGLELHHGSTLSPGAAAAIAKAARWGKYYLYFILAYFAFIFGVQLITIGGAGAAASEFGGAAGFGAAAGVGSVLFAIVISLLLYAYPVIKFWGFTHDTPGAIARGSQRDFVGAVDKLRSVYKYISVFLIVVFAIYALLFIGVVLLGGLGALAG